MKNLNQYINEKLILKRSLQSENCFEDLQEILRKNDLSFLICETAITKWFIENRDIFPKEFNLIVKEDTVMIGIAINNISYRIKRNSPLRFYLEKNDLYLNVINLEHQEFESETLLGVFKSEAGFNDFITDFTKQYNFEFVKGNTSLITYKFNKK
jgi:hypothetical protein